MYEWKGTRKKTCQVSTSCAFKADKSTSNLSLQWTASSSMFPVISLGFTMLGKIFAYVIGFFLFCFFYPTIEVVTFCLRGW